MFFGQMFPGLVWFGVKNAILRMIIIKKNPQAKTTTMFKLTDMKATFLLLLLSGTSSHDSLVNIPTLEFLFKLDVFFCHKYDINLLCLVLFYGVCEVDPF